MRGKPDLDITVSTIYPGYIRSEMNEKVEQRTKFMVDTETGVRGIVEAIEKGGRRGPCPGLAVEAARDRDAPPPSRTRPSGSPDSGSQGEEECGLVVALRV